MCRPCRVPSIRVSPLQFTGRTVISVQLLPNASVIWEVSHSKLLGEGMSQGKGSVSEIGTSGLYTTFCSGLSSDLMKLLPPAQQGLLCSKCFNYRGGWGLGCSPPHHVELKKKATLLHPWKYEVQSHLLVSKLIETTGAVNLLEQLNMLLLLLYEWVNLCPERFFDTVDYPV